MRCIVLTTAITSKAKSELYSCQGKQRLQSRLGPPLDPPRLVGRGFSVLDHHQRRHGGKEVP